MARKTAPASAPEPEAPPFDGPFLRADRQRHVALVFNRGHKLTHYLAHNGTHVTVCKCEHDVFERQWYHTPMKRVAGEELPRTPLDYAKAYLLDNHVPVSSGAVRVLQTIINGHRATPGGEIPSTLLEKAMAKAAAVEHRKPDGPVAQIHTYLDKRLDAIKAGTVSRKELVDKLLELGFKEGTAVTQAGRWARTNGIRFVRPTEAAENKSAKRKKAAKQ